MAPPATDPVLLRLCKAVHEVSPLVEVSDPGLRVDVGAPAAVSGAQRLLDRLTRKLGLPRVAALSGRRGLRAAELVLSDRLTPGGVTVGDAERLSVLPDAHLDRAVAQAWEGAPFKTTVRGRDGAPLRCYSAGTPGNPAVVLASACGMPVGLTGAWIDRLSPDFNVLTWESRGMFGADPGFDGRGHGVLDQAGDLHSVMAAFDVCRAHIVALCGGAAIALAAARPEIISLSLLFGDYELGEDAPKTRHQKDLQTMLAMAGRSRESARQLQRLFSRPAVLDKLRADLSHHLLYPYANAELLYRYGRLNGAIMTTDCRPLVRRAVRPALVVTSRDDTTAHCEGSVRVARELTQGRLEFIGSGGHLSAFDASAELVERVAGFIDDHSP